MSAVAPLDAVSSIEAFRAEMERIVEEALAKSEQGTLGAGKALQAIVRDAKEFIEETEQTMSRIEATDEEASVMDLIGDQSQLIRGFIHDLNERVERQNDIATTAERSLQDITEAGATIDRITRESRMLALNALIETHRLGQDGRSLAVIADHMKQLSETVADANEGIAELSRQLLKVIPEMASNTREMRRTCDDFSSEVSAQIGDVARRTDELREVVDAVRSLGRGRLDQIVRTSHEALSHLAFQDPVAQSLRRMVLMPVGEDEAAPADLAEGHDEEDATDDGESAAAGELLLF
ncbi:MAG: methyl-accepting chemotaxis protein [Myxococcota bacterium]